MIIGNWKSNTFDLLWPSNFIREYIYDKSSIFGVAPPSIYIEKVRSELYSIQELDNKFAVSSPLLGVQDVDHSSGSRTGAISVDMLQDFEIDFAIIGHSERRQYFQEDNDLIKEKLKSLNERVMTILCIGETKEENDKNITKDILKEQLDVVSGVNLFGTFTVAYEPVWAIGSGLTPEPKDINEIHKYIKDVVQSNSANNLIPKVLYGGSVTDKNAESFFKEEFVDGALIGGASLDGSTYAKIVNIFNGIDK